MNFFDGLKTIWSDPEIRKTAIKSTVAAVAATGVATYAVTRAATRKQRKANEAYLAEPKTTMVDGELYKKMPMVRWCPTSLVTNRTPGMTTTRSMRIVRRMRSRPMMSSTSRGVPM